MAETETKQVNAKWTYATLTLVCFTFIEVVLMKGYDIDTFPLSGSALLFAALLPCFAVFTLLYTISLKGQEGGWKKRILHFLEMPFVAHFQDSCMFLFVVAILLLLFHLSLWLGCAVLAAIGVYFYKLIKM